jgi:hypothetical protein
MHNHAHTRRQRGPVQSRILRRQHRHMQSGQVRTSSCEISLSTSITSRAAASLAARRSASISSCVEGMGCGGADARRGYKRGAVAIGVLEPSMEYVLRSLNADYGSMGLIFPGWIFPDLIRRP